MENTTIIKTYSKHETPILSRKDLQRTFGGRIYLYDFDTEHSIGNITSRIISDQRFDYQCSQNTIAREKGRRREITQWK